VGTKYYSNTLQGEIVSAEPHPKAVWYEGAEAYLVEVKPNRGFTNSFRTIAVKTN
jgi:hypothetical protein